jgi:bifunctional DNase/RNase
LNLEARPSDAIAIATRTDYLVPIYVNETLLKTMGEKIC